MLDQLFRLPFLTGLLLTVIVALLGAYLRLRGEWMAALGLPHIAAAGGVAAVSLGLPLTLGAALTTASAAAIKSLLAGSGNSAFALMLILGWGAALTLSGHLAQGEVSAEELLGGQIYFTTAAHLYAALALAVACLLSLPWLNHRLLLQRFFPDHFRANRRPAWPHELLFAALLVMAVVLATVSLGALPAFALFFVPPWVAFGLVRQWKQGLVLTVALALAAYLLAFLLAILMDQPFGPTLTLLLALMAALRWAVQRPL
ncbi:MAG: metal ABC transporter permease [Oleiphilaceae bacterium]|nr:metal ABC transporter permease [Oleiphilaceae bacterium]